MQNKIIKYGKAKIEKEYFFDILIELINEKYNSALLIIERMKNLNQDNPQKLLTLSFFEVYCYLKTAENETEIENIKIRSENIDFDILETVVENNLPLSYKEFLTDFVDNITIEYFKELKRSLLEEPLSNPDQYPDEHTIIHKDTSHIANLRLIKN